MCNKAPIILYDLLNETFNTEKRAPGLGKFYDNSRGKIGRQKFGYNLGFMAAIMDDWNGLDLSNDCIHIILKKTFLNNLTIGNNLLA